nr:uncharacterized protein LOC111989631 isoform X2 [Quercus suber]
MRRNMPRLQLDVTNGSDLGLGFDSTVGDGFDLASSSTVYSSVNCDSDFNPYPQLKKKILLIKFLENMTRARWTSAYVSTLHCEILSSCEQIPN